MSNFGETKPTCVWCDEGKRPHSSNLVEKINQFPMQMNVRATHLLHELMWMSELEEKRVAEFELSQTISALRLCFGWRFYRGVQPVPVNVLIFYFRAGEFQMEFFTTVAVLSTPYAIRVFRTGFQCAQNQRKCHCNWIHGGEHKHFRCFKN